MKARGKLYNSRKYLHNSHGNDFDMLKSKRNFLVFIICHSIVICECVIHVTSFRNCVTLFRCITLYFVNNTKGQWGVHSLKFLTFLEPKTMKKFDENDAKRIGNDLGINWKEVSLDQFTKGLNVELEHGSKDPQTDVTGNNGKLTGEIALAHLKEFPDYYTRLHKMDKEATEHFKK